MHDAYTIGIPVLVILIANFMNRADLKEFRAEMNLKLDKMQAQMDDRFEKMQAQMDDRFEKMQAQMDRRFDDIDAETALLSWPRWQTRCPAYPA